MFVVIFVLDITLIKNKIKIVGTILYYAHIEEKFIEHINSFAYKYKCLILHVL